MIAERMARIDSSGIRKVFDLARNMKDPVNLSIGQPDFDVPDPVKDEAARWIREGFNKYTVTQGVEELRVKILAHLRVARGVHSQDILITSGVSGGIFLAFLAVLNPGDEVICADPYFVMYKHLANLLGAKPVYVDTYPDFVLTADRVHSAVTPRTKLILVNTPSNPTGVTVPETELEELARLADRHGILILSDEIYSRFVYDQPFESIARRYPKTLVLDGFSKSYAMTGWRLGYAAGPADVVGAMTKLQQFSFVCAPSFAQKAAIKAMDVDMAPRIREYRKKRDLIYEGLKEAYEVTKPGGAFYVFPKAPDGDGDAFVKRAIENNLLIIPGSVFSERSTHFRISFAASDETILKGIDILRKMV